MFIHVDMIKYASLTCCNRNTINILAIKTHIYISTFAHENQRNVFFIQFNEPTSDGTTAFHQTIDWLSQVSL